MKRKTKAKKNKIGRTKNTLRQAYCGNNIDKKNSKNCRKIAFLGRFTKHKNKNTGNNKQNHQKTKKKNIPKKNLFAFWQTTTIFGKFLFFYQGTFFHVYKAVFCWEHYKNSVFSGTQLLGTTDSKTPFRGKTQNGTFATKSAILGFPLCPLKPLFL